VSVAFRRESDEEHKEPRFELPIPPGENLVTSTGRAQIAAKVAELEALVASNPDELRLAEAQRDLRYWRTRLSTARVAPPAPVDRVGFGSRVRFRLDGAERTIDIVGHDEADPPNGRIAFTAPLARAMIGAEEGDLVDFAGAAEAIEILEVAPSPA
jgi:transcription elongation GreA/GreB family factor